MVHWIRAWTAVAAVVAMAPTALGFYSNGRWSQTATNGPTGPTGSPVTVTWSIVPDGTPIPGYGPSNFVAFMDGVHGGAAGTVDQRPWFPLLQQSFDRWTELGGLRFVYEPADDGVTHGNFAGVLGTRGDIRIGGVDIDGPGNANGQTQFLDRADITIDTSELAFFQISADNFLNFRNTLMHETGHALGLGHIDSSAEFLMNTESSTEYDGPQIDEIRGVQQLYGDALERAAGGPNNSFAAATAAGTLTFSAPYVIGLDAATGTGVLPEETDFVSIANLADEDFFSFTVPGAAMVDVVVTPTGANYFEKPTGFGTNMLTRSSRISDLQVELYEESDGLPQLIASAAAAPLGQPESLLGISVDPSATYYVRILGDANGVQLYHLSLTATATGLAGDFNQSGGVDGADFLDWQRGVPAEFDAGDLAAWESHFGQGGGGAFATPEPAPWRLALAAAGLAGSWAYVSARTRCAIFAQFSRSPSARFR